MKYLLVFYIFFHLNILYSQKQYILEAPNVSYFNYGGSVELDNGNVVSCFRNFSDTVLSTESIYCSEIVFYYFNKELDPIDTVSFIIDCDPHKNNYIRTNIVKSGSKIYFASGLWDEVEHHHAGHRIYCFDPINKTHEIIATSLDTMGSQSQVEWTLFIDTLTDNLVLFKRYKAVSKDIFYFNLNSQEQIRLNVDDPGLLSSKSFVISGITVEDGYIYFLDDYMSKYNLATKEFTHKIAKSYRPIPLISYTNNCRIINDHIISVFYSFADDPMTGIMKFKLSSLSYTFQDKPEDIIQKDVNILGSPCSYPTQFSDDLGPTNSGHFTTAFTHRGYKSNVCDGLYGNNSFENYYGIYVFDQFLNICDTISFIDGHTVVLIKNQVNDSIVAIGGYRAYGEGFNDPNIQHYSFVRFININETCAKELSIKEHPSFAKSKVFPNPTNGMLKIEMEGQQPEFILIFNSVGTKVKKVSFSESKMDVSGLESGVYFYKALDHRGVVTHIGKFVKI